MARGKPFELGNPGRPSGSLNKRTLALEACEKMKVDPFAFLASVVAGKLKDATLRERISAALVLAEYLQPKLSRSEVVVEETGSGENPYAHLSPAQLFAEMERREALKAQAEEDEELDS